MNFVKIGLLFISITWGTVAETSLPCGNPPVHTKPSDHIKGHDARIIGGIAAHAGEYPWAVSLQSIRDIKHGFKHSCGGSVISHQWILSAAHCGRDAWRERKLQVVAGCLDRTSKTCQKRPFEFGDMYLHERFNLETYSDDIMLIWIREPLVYSDEIETALSNICIPPKGFYPNGYATVIGWGKTSLRYSSPPNLLRTLEVKILNASDCRLYDVYRPQTQVCAGYRRGEKDSCVGDSGGPLHIRYGNSYFQVGIVSYGKICAEAGYPGVYSRVLEFRDWIIGITGLDL